MFSVISVCRYEQCVGVGTLDRTEAKNSCGICIKNLEVNNVFHRAADELIKSVGSVAEARDKFREAEGEYCKAKQKRMSDRDIDAFRKKMKKAFFAYTAWAWESAERYRQSKPVEDNNDAISEFTDYMQVM